MICKSVDDGKLLAALRADVKVLQQQVETLQKRLEDSGMLHGGAVAYSSTWTGIAYPVNTAVGICVTAKQGE